MKQLIKIIFAITVLFMLMNCNSSKMVSDNYSQRIDSLVQTKNNGAFNGVILITENGKTKYSKAYGLENFNTKISLKLNGQFEIMSNTKQITAVLILKEVEKGNLNLQMPIKKYLPFLTQSWADSVTVHQLLNHTHGIVDIEKPLIFKQGSDFKYGNLSNILLGKIIENSTKKSYSDVANELFKTLKMEDTFCYSKTEKRNLVSGHLVEDNKFEIVENPFINDENLPADGVITTAKDLSIWNEALHNGKIISPKSYLSMTTESVKSQHDVFGKEKMGYGYNIRIAEENGIKYLGHTGLGGGFSSLNVYFPKSKESLIILQNQMPKNSEQYYFYETAIKKIVLESKLVK